ncbi:CCA tRNA nucleotidyltransferase [Candidatus Woesearchaeota archaeon]|nr:CCA tRNA nucleotidyltransferase [Candidatus Woesearchaeota archaeon]
MDFKKKLIKENSVKVEDYSAVISKIKKAFNKSKVKVDVVLGGSVAKGTYLKNYDFDIFVQFHKNPSSDVLEKILKMIFKKTERQHGSRDYFKIKCQGKTYEIVPVLKIKKAEEAKNVTDVSMLHVEWVKKHLKNPEQVKLAKLFCKSQKVYGAESYISGFSGYILEILSVYYGSFDKLIRNVADWKPKVIIDVAKHYKNKKQIMNELNASKLVSPIIIIDPVQKDRNAAAAVSMEKFTKFVKAANDYLRKPSVKFFEKHKFSKDSLKKEADELKGLLLMLKAEPVDGKEDVVYGKLLKVYEYIKNQLGYNDFTVLKSEFEFDENLLWYIVSPKQLPEKKKQKGPKLGVRKDFIQKFKEKYKNAKIQKGFWTAVVARKYRTSRKLIDNLIKTDYVRERVKKIKWH